MANKINTLFKNIIVLIIFLLALELVLFMLGYERGLYEKTPYFNKVEKLVELKGYCTDSNGIMKVDREASMYASSMLTKNKQINMFSKLLENYRLYLNDCHFTPYNIGRDYLEIKQKNYTNDFSAYLSKIQKNAVTNYDSLLLNYLDHPINREGFRSIDFTPIKCKKLKVLLLGDSFTWGSATKNVTNSFADILLSKGYIVYNTGIVGADLPQYFAIAKKYVALLKPNVVIVNLYMGNDISKYDRELKSNMPIYYSTNAGNLYSCPHGKYFKTAQEAYNHIVHISSMPSTTTLSRMMSLSRITTQVYSIMARRGLIKSDYNNANSEYFKQASKREIGYSINIKYLKLIQEICVTNNSKCLVSIIPDHKNFKDNPSNYIKEIEYHKLVTIDKSYYAKDGHFNDMGHKNYAEFLNGLLNNLQHD